MNTLARALAKRLSKPCIAEILDSLLSVWDDPIADDGDTIPDDEVDAATGLFHALSDRCPDAVVMAQEARYQPATEKVE